MEFKEKYGMKGKLTLSLFNKDKLIFSYTQDNTIVNNGYLTAASLLASKFTDFQLKYLGFGDGTDNTFSNDLDLKGANKRKNLSLDFNQTTTSGTNKALLYWAINYDTDIAGYNFGTGVWVAGTSFTIKEFGLFTSNQTLFNRILWSGPDLVLNTGIKLEGYFTVTLNAIA